MTVHRAGRESYDITLSNLPEGQQRERLIRRFAPAATNENAAALFAKSLPPEWWSNLASQPRSRRSRAGDQRRGSEAEIVWPAGRLVFRKMTSPISAGASPVWLLKRRRSSGRPARSGALRTNAADYERAAARGLR